MTPNNKILSLAFTGATLALFSMQFYAIVMSAQLFGAHPAMAIFLAFGGGLMPDLLVWLPHLKDWSNKKLYRYLSHLLGGGLSTYLGYLFSSMMTDDPSLFWIYMTLQFSLIVAQFTTAEDAAKTLNILLGGEDVHPLVKGVQDTLKLGNQLTGLLDANNDLTLKMIDEKFNQVVDLIDAIPQPQPVDFAPVFDNQAEMFGGVRDLTLLVKVQGERIEELNEAVRGLQAVPVTAPKPPKKNMSPDERVEWLKDNDEAYINHLAVLTNLTVPTIKRDLYKARNGVGK